MGGVVDVNGIHNDSTVLKDLDLLGDTSYCKKVVVLVKFNTGKEKRESGWLINNYFQNLKTILSKLFVGKKSMTKCMYRLMKFLRQVINN